LPEVDRADLVEHIFDEVQDADRHATGRDHDVPDVGGLESRARSSSRTSGTMPRSSTSPPHCSIDRAA